MGYAATATLSADSHTQQTCWRYEFSFSRELLYEKRANLWGWILKSESPAQE